MCVASLMSVRSLRLIDVFLRTTAGKLNNRTVSPLPTNATFTNRGFWTNPTWTPASWSLRIHFAEPSAQDH